MWEYSNSYTPKGNSSKISQINLLQREMGDGI